MIRSFLLPCVIALGLAVNLSGCSTLVPSTLRALEQISPLTANPADIAVSVQLTEGVNPVPSATLLGFSMARSDTGESKTVSVPLRIQETGTNTHILSIPPSQYDALRSFQATAQQWKAEAPRAAKGSLSLTAQVCTSDGQVPPGAKVSVSVQFAQGAPFEPLFRDAPLTKLAKAGGVQRCAAPQ